MIVSEFLNPDTTVLIYTYLPTGSIGLNTTIIISLSMKLFMNAYVNTVRWGVFFWFCLGASFTHHSSGLDDLLSKHISHLFIRDPLVIFSETINQDDCSSTDHFEVEYYTSSSPSQLISFM
jgi:hypothetical protein